jgi:hypothetical protein
VRGWLVGLMAATACRYGFTEIPGDAAGDGAARDAQVPATGMCARIPSLAAPPTFDGALEAGLVAETLVPVGWLASDASAPLPDIPVQFAVAYRPDGVYFFVDVADPNLFPARPQDFSYCGDGIEIYVDHDGVFTNAPQFDIPGAVQFIARAPETATAPRSEGEYYVDRSLGGTWSTQMVAVPRSGGYVVEAFIDAPAMMIGSWPLAAGERVGFDLGVNVSSPDGSVVQGNDCPQSCRLGQFFLRIDEANANEYAGGAPFVYPAALCSALLE